MQAGRAVWVGSGKGGQDGSRDVRARSHGGYPFVQEFSRLGMTDYWFLLGVWLVLFWATDPFGWNLDLIAVVKHLPIVVTAPAFALAFAGGVLFPRRIPDIPVARIISLAAPVFMFSAFVVTGSLFAKFGKGIENTFLNMGTFALVAPLTAWFVLRSKAPLRLIRSMLLIFAWWATISAAVQLVEFGSRAVFHGREHLVFPLALLGYFSTASKPLRAVILIAVVLVAIAAKKNTAYLVAIVTIGYVCASALTVAAGRIGDGVERFVLRASAVLLASVLIAALVFAHTHSGSSVPSGNPEFRLSTYDKAWKKFLEFPVWGRGFADASSEKFERYQVGGGQQVVPTHSDPLDLLAHGGILGLAVWLWIFLRVGRRCWTLRSARILFGPASGPHVHTLLGIGLCGILVCAFNPIFNTPNLTSAYWTVIGALMALLLIAETEQVPATGRESWDS